jgi:hypothetical protein
VCPSYHFVYFQLLFSMVPTLMIETILNGKDFYSLVFCYFLSAPILVTVFVKPRVI